MELCIIKETHHPEKLDSFFFIFYYNILFTMIYIIYRYIRLRHTQHTAGELDDFERVTCGDQTHPSGRDWNSYSLYIDVLNNNK
jgi:hypothetical protein